MLTNDNARPVAEALARALSEDEQHALMSPNGGWDQQQSTTRLVDIGLLHRLDPATYVRTSAGDVVRDTLLGML